jgi:hypothetical protein
MKRIVFALIFFGAAALVMGLSDFYKDATTYELSADSAASPDSTYDSTYIALCPNSFQFRTATIRIHIGAVRSALGGAGKAARINLICYSSMGDSLLAIDSAKYSGDLTAAAGKTYYKAWIGSVGDTLFKHSLQFKVSYADTADQSSAKIYIPIKWEMIGKQ